MLNGVENKFRLNAFQVVTGKGIIPSATVKVAISQPGGGEKIIDATQIGVGPVDAIFQSIVSATGEHISMTKYDVSSSVPGSSALGNVTVQVKNGSSEVYIGIARGDDTMVATAEAIIKALNHMHDHPAPKKQSCF